MEEWATMQLDSNKKVIFYSVYFLNKPYIKVKDTNPKYTTG